MDRSKYTELSDGNGGVVIAKEIKQGVYSLNAELPRPNHRKRDKAKARQQRNSRKQNRGNK
jgi:hypothetical protein